MFDIQPDYSSSDFNFYDSYLKYKKKSCYSTSVDDRFYSPKVITMVSIILGV